MWSTWRGPARASAEPAGGAAPAAHLLPGNQRPAMSAAYASTAAALETLDDDANSARIQAERRALARRPCRRLCWQTRHLRHL
eukprot:7441633-Alexandrium_andersonii.AAC.1